MKRFEIITEADARMLEIGSTVELAPGGIVTPLARDTLAARRVTVVATGTMRSVSCRRISRRWRTFAAWRSAAITAASRSSARSFSTCGVAAWP